MRSVAAKLFAASMVLLTSLPARAAAFNPASVPADTQWIIHVDVDKLGTTFKIAPATLSEMLVQTPGVKGVNKPQDIHDITLYGNGFTLDTAAVGIIHGESGRIITALLAQTAYTDTYNGHTIHTDVKLGSGKAPSPPGSHRNDGLFATVGQTMLISNNEDAIKTALDILDGKGQSLAADSPFRLIDQTGVLVYMGAQGFANLPVDIGPQSPMLKRVKSAWLTIGESQDHTAITCKSLITAQTKNDAFQINATLLGIKALAIMSIPPQAASTTPDKAIVKALLDGLVIDAKNDTVTIADALPFNMVQRRIQIEVDKEKDYLKKREARAIAQTQAADAMNGAHPDIATAQAQMKKAQAEMAAAKAEMKKAQAEMAAATEAMKQAQSSTTAPATSDESPAAKP